MNKPIIEVKNLSKKYSLGERQPYHSFRDTISGIFHTPIIKEKLKNDEFWALKDITFEVEKGEAIGVIGRNGAGKSTLLKILSQITPPTEGEINLRGGVASLLEVGTGFHSELTGRENIYLNGAILGMKRWEINSKFNEIVEFSEIERFLDTPVKHYSSGMYMRLAFAVAAHLEPDVLIVDEVLAVGDVKFQKKCLGKMNDVSRKEGRTVLFVSHNMGAISQLCSSALVLEKGQLTFRGKTAEAISLYLEKNKTNNLIFKRDELQLINRNQFVTIYNSDLENNTKSEYGYEDEIRLIFEINLPDWDESLEVGIFPCDTQGRRIFMIEVPLKKYYSGKQRIKLAVTIPSGILAVGEYFWEIFIHNPLISLHDHQKEICNFSIIETGSPFARYGNYNWGCVVPPKYSVIKL